MLAHSLRGRANGVEFENTYARNKPIVLRFGGRPFTGGICEGVEQALAGMKAGGKRVVVGTSAKVSCLGGGWVAVEPALLR